MRPSERDAILALAGTPPDNAEELAALEAERVRRRAARPTREHEPIIIRAGDDAMKKRGLPHQSNRERERRRRQLERTR